MTGQRLENTAVELAVIAVVGAVVSAFLVPAFQAILLSLLQVVPATTNTNLSSYILHFAVILLSIFSLLSIVNFSTRASDSRGWLGIIVSFIVAVSASKMLFGNGMAAVIFVMGIVILALIKKT